MTYRLALVLALVLLAPCSSPVFATPPETRAEDDPPVQRPITVGQAAVLGVVAGLTEYLPVSSTGHLILASHIMGLSRFIEERAWLGRKLESPPALGTFEIVIQFGAILAVLGLYRRRVMQMTAGVLGRDRDGLRLTGLLLVAFAPAVVIGLLFHDFISEHLFSPATVCLALAVGGAVMLAVERFTPVRRRASHEGLGLLQITYTQALVIGLAQVIAMWPGTSRSMVTIVAAMLLGMSRLAAAEFSFLLALPTLGGATVYAAWRGWEDLLHSAGWDGLLVGLVVSGIVAALAVAGFVRYLTRHGLAAFGVYRILVALVLAVLLLR